MKNKNKAQYKDKQKYKVKQLLIIILLAICCISIVVIFGRYVTNSVNNFFVRSKEFYFYSDKLTKTRADYQIDNWSGVDDYVITINMNSKKNNLQSATYDISYDISYRCSTNAICQLSKTQGVITADKNTDFFNLTITPNTQLTTGDKVIVDIEVTSTAQYTRNIKRKVYISCRARKFNISNNR